MKQNTLFFRTPLLVLLVLTAAVFALYAQVPTVRIAQYSSNVIGVATFDPTDMPYRSVLAGLANGELHEIFYAPGTPAQRGDSVLGYFNGITAVAGFYAANDQFRIAIVGTQDGNLTELFYHPTKGRGRSVIASFPGNRILSLAAFYNPYDAHRVVFVALSNGYVYEVKYHPSVGVRVSPRIYFGVGGVQAVAGNPVYGGQTRRLLISTTGGYLYEYFINNQTNTLMYGQTMIRGSANPLTSISTNGSFTVGAASRVGAGFVYTGRMNPVLLPGVGTVAADAAGRNYNNFIYSWGSAVYTTNYTTY